MKSKLFRRDFDPKLSFEEDFKKVLEISDAVMTDIVDFLTEDQRIIEIIVGSEIQRLSETTGLTGADTANAIQILQFISRSVLTTDDSLDAIMEDLEELSLLDASHRENLTRHFEKLLGDVDSLKASAQNARTEQMVLPVLESISFAVDLRVVTEGDDDDFMDPMAPYKPKYIGFSRVALFGLKLDQTAPQRRIFFQTGKDGLRRAVKVLQNALSDIERLEKMPLDENLDSEDQNESDD